MRPGQSAIGRRQNTEGKRTEFDIPSVREDCRNGKFSFPVIKVELERDEACMHGGNRGKGTTAKSGEIQSLPDDFLGRKRAVGGAV